MSSSNLTTPKIPHHLEAKEFFSCVPLLVGHSDPLKFHGSQIGSEFLNEKG